MKSFQDIQSVIESLPIPICIRELKDGNRWCYSHCNAAWFKMASATPEKAIGYTLYETLINCGHPPYLAKGIASVSDKTDDDLIRNKKIGAYETAQSHYDYEYIRVYKHFTKIDGEDCILAAIFDISDRVRSEKIKDKLQETLLASSKMTLIGEFARGLAHELNNPLQILISDVEELEDRMLSCDSCPRKINDDCQTCFGKMENLLTSVRLSIDIINHVIYSIQDHVEKFDKKKPAEFYVKDAAKDALNILKVKNIRHKIKVIDKTEDCDCRVFCVKADLVQVFINLFVNAMDAVKNLPLDRRVMEVDCIKLANDTVFITVSDYGDGVPESIKDKIFDPFITSKVAEVDRKTNLKTGSGLGLSISRQLISYNYGEIKYKREDGMTKFICILPSKNINMKEESVHG